MSTKKIAMEWDAIAKHRCSQIASGKDFSHDLVLIPSLLKLVKELDPRYIVDIGAGCGFLTAKLPVLKTKIVGIDISKEMVLLAQKRFANRPNLRFEHASLQKFAKSNPRSFDLAISNMALNTMGNLNSTLQYIFSILKRNGMFIFSTIHPCFWNCYRQAEPDSSFDYWKEHSVTAPFQITSEPNSQYKTTYFHRSLADYANGLANAGFHLQQIIEPQAPKSAPLKYRRNFQFPRFLLVSAKRL